MMLSVKQLPLQYEVIQSNASAISSMNRKAVNIIAMKLQLPPNSKIVLQINEAIRKGVKILKTNDLALLNLAKSIELNFGIKVTK